MRRLEGGCSVPLGVFTTLITTPTGYNLTITGSVTSLDGLEQLLQEESVDLEWNREGDGISGRTEVVQKAREVGEKVAEVLKGRGAVQMLEIIKGSGI